MAVYATHFLCRTVDADDQLMDQVLVAGKTVFLEDPRVGPLDHDRLVKVLDRESLGVVPAVVGLGEILAEEAVRKMAIDTVGHRMMAGLLPGVELGLHDMAVHARPGIGTEVREAFCVEEGIASQSGEDA
jgi:hypothetical protein